MKIGFVINDFASERPEYTTTRLALTATAMGHEVWYITVGDFVHDPGGAGCIAAHARAAPKKRYSSPEVFLADLAGKKAKQERVGLGDLDVLMLRNDPAQDAVDRPWAEQAGVVFGRRAVHQGTIVLNDPNGLSKALNKMYFQEFPEEVRPRTLITRDREEIKAFAREEGGTIVLKPLQGSGGHGVFLVRPDSSNVNQMIDAVIRDGYVVAQEYLPGAEAGDLRLFLMNGKPLLYKGKYAAFRRERAGGDLRSNISAGGKVAKAQVGDVELRIADLIRPKLIRDGMFLVGLDLVGDKLMEVNVFSPGGLGCAERFEKVNFYRAVVEALDRKLPYARYHRRSTDNAMIATL